MVDISIIESTSRAANARSTRFGFLYGLLVVVIITLVGRSVYLQLYQGGSLRAQAEGNRVSVIPESAPRGIITDRFGAQLVENIASTDVVLDPRLLPPEEFEAPLIEKLPAELEVSQQEVQEKIALARATQRVVTVRKAIPHELVLRLEENQTQFPGLQLVSSLVRKYPHHQALAHVIGYTSAVSSEELERNSALLPTDSTGKTGLEKQYDVDLRGVAGQVHREVNAEGRPQKELGRKPPQPGTSLRLGVDLEFQQFVYERLAEYTPPTPTANGDRPARAGAVVALDPRSGEVRALVSFPSFDPNAFSQPGLRAEAQRILEAPLQPLFNRTTDGTYPPGSTIKPLIAAAGLAEGVITPTTTVVSTGGLAVGPWHFPDWKGGGHGVTDVKKAIAESVNTFFYLLSGGDATHPGLGVTALHKYLTAFGWGEPTGIDLPSEASGFVPTPAWKERVKKEPWYIGDTYHLGIGQGDALATPLQIAMATGTIAMHGTWYEPHLVTELTPPEKATIRPKNKKHTIAISRDNLDVVRAGMRQTVTEGSGRGLAALPVALAGKTGTAQIGGTDDTHAWFTSFGPYDTPELVLTVLLERGGEGDDAAVPFAREIWQWWAEHRSNQ